MAGTSIGTVVIFPLGGVLAATLGWRWVFYVTGSLNLLLSAIWWPLVYDTPEEHKWISQRERTYLVDSQKDTMGANVPVGSTPWGAMLTSGPVWAIFISHIASNWGLYQLQALMPTYLNDVLGLDLYSNGLFNSLPYLLQTLVSYGG